MILTQAAIDRPRYGLSRCFETKPFQPHQAGVPEQVRADLALLERRKVDAVDPPRQQPARLVLRIDSGSLRRSSPSLTSMSKA